MTLSSTACPPGAFPLTAIPPGLEPFVFDLFVPEYRPLQSGAWRIHHGRNLLAQGYWSPTRLVPRVTALVRGDHTWMSTTPIELESQEIGVRLSAGHVVVFGLGMGWSAVASALRPEVTAVTVVEIDPEVIALHRELDLAAQLPPEARAKIRIVEGDALAWRPERPVDLLMPDIWLPLVSDDRVAEVRRMQANVQAANLYFWGQELEIARHAAAARRALDEGGIRDTIAAFELPLVGPALPDYADKVRQVAARHMRGRWLPGTTGTAPAAATS
ncbi:hypothetical protein SAMN04487843_12160 [Methylobacterium sp. ap11]|uniref:hypothetical protein n=1 Tax=Methylobacterium sp. ap11 TaxID=1761799 RepID=UPI0008CBAB67|nr:hypothetical protein [Methylobacterium sp. ap11]SEP44960.1 hypothetical protein SAMN04487843_12160 [Methylobacterium sp. ap11]